jgi:hypothetical protein
MDGLKQLLAFGDFTKLPQSGGSDDLDDVNAAVCSAKN